MRSRRRPAEVPPCQRQAAKTVKALYGSSKRRVHLNTPWKARRSGNPPLMGGGEVIVEAERSRLAHHDRAVEDVPDRVCHA